MRYRLDDLGWQQFEELCQCLLKAKFGLGVESWGGRGDWGRDAYLDGSVTLSEADGPIAGPWVFQAKFVGSANAAGATPAPALVNAVAAECRRIEARKRQSQWSPAGYLLVTNTPCSPNTRGVVEQKLSAVGAGGPGRVHTWFGDDLCDILDEMPGLARKFPPLLGLRDLDHLLRQAVAADVIGRSADAIGIARELARVFVTTRAYEKAHAVLERHHFLVLMGAPEVGKTSIARMIGLTAVADGWEYYECRGPEDLYRVRDRSPDRKQIFVVDDAFGSTEFDPLLAREWEKDLARTVHGLGECHHLVFTSRPVPLQLAIERMHLQDSVREFPSPADVTVDVHSLSILECAKIAYRHAKAADLPATTRDVLKAQCAMVVKHPSFTPLRAMLLMQAVQREDAGGRMTPQVFKGLVGDYIARNPDTVMKSLRALPNEHKWYLAAALEATSSQPSNGAKVVADAYRRLAPEPCGREPEQVATDLSGQFIRRGGTQVTPTVEWIHPTYRDAVIEWLSGNPSARTRFLTHAGVRGIRLALSSGGGHAGTRSHPLLRNPADVSLLHRRLRAWATTADLPGVGGLLHFLASLSLDAGHPAMPVLGDVLATVRARWDEWGHPVSVYILAPYADLRDHVTPRPAMPDLRPTWKQVANQLRWCDGGPVQTIDALDSASEFVLLVAKCAPAFLSARGLPASAEQLVLRALGFLGEYPAGLQQSGDPHSDVLGDLEGVRSVCTNVAKAFRGSAYEASRLLDEVERAIRLVEEDPENPENQLDEDDLPISADVTPEEVFRDL